MHTNGEPYATDTATDTRRIRHLYRLTVAQAADRLGITQDAVRQRIRRDTIRHEKDENGRVYVFLDSTNTEHDGVHNDVHDSVRDELVEELRDRVRALEEANRETRRLLAGALERIPAIESPETQDGPETVPEEAAGTSARADEGERETESSRPSFWRRFFGIE